MLNVNVVYLCKSHIRLHNRPHLCRTRRKIPVRTSPRASPTLCGSSAPLCRLHRPGNSRSHPGPSVCTAVSRHTAPRCICRGSSPRTWHWRPTPQHLALWVKTALWWGEKTSRDAGRELVKGLLSFGCLGKRRQRSGPPLADLSQWSDLWFIRLYGYQRWTTLFCTLLALVNFLIPVLSSFLPVSPLFRNPAWKWD